LDINDTYFEPESSLFQESQIVVAYTATKYINKNGRRVDVKTNTVDMFSSPTNLTHENKIGEIPNNSEVEIVDVYEQSLPGGHKWITYKVKHRGKEGWIWDTDINDTYIQPEPSLSKGTQNVVVYTATKYINKNGRRVEVKTNTVDMFSSPTNLTHVTKIGEIPNNSEVEIVDVYEQTLLGGDKWITYKVKHKGKEGWIWDFHIK
jgi:hypothetical protein